MVRGKKNDQRKGRKRTRVRRNGVSDDSSDEDYILEEEEEEEEEQVFDNSCTSRYRSGDENSDFATTSSCSDDEIRTVRSKPRKRFPGRKRRRSKVRKTIRKARVSRKKEEEVEDEEFLPDSDDDEDDSFEDEVEEEEDESLVVKKRTRIRRRKVSKKIGSLKRRKTIKKSKISKKSKILKKSSTKKRKRLVSRRKGGDSDDDFVDGDRIVRARKRLEPRRIRKKRSMAVVSDSDFVHLGSSDSDFTISEEGRVHVRETMNHRSLATSSRSLSLSKRCQAEEGSHRRFLRRKDHGSVKNKKDDLNGRKGKEKVGNLMLVDLGKQVCGICLSEEQNTSIRGLLNCCNHYFCFACIMEWSKVESRCPVCKQRFMTISKSARIEMGPRKSVIRVPRCDQVYRPSDEEFRGYLDPYANTVCMECQQGRDDNLMLLCDICDSAAHTYCVGLGRAVPEGNWYCEGCRSADPGSSNLQPQDSVPDQVTSNSSSHAEDSAGGIDSVGHDTSHRHSRLSIHLPEQSFSMGSGTHISPRNLRQDLEVASSASGAGASTVLGRRRLRRQIHILLSNNRRSPIPETDEQPNGLRHCNLESEVVQSAQETAGSARTAEFGAQVTPDIGSIRDGPCSSITDGPAEEGIGAGEGINTSWVDSDFRQWLQDNRHFLGYGAYTAPCGYTEGSSFRRVDGAKELVRTMVKTHLKRLCRDANIGPIMFKKIARNSTHTILAACGIEHVTSEATPLQSPPNCSHVRKEVERLNLMKGCCSSCFGSFLGDVVMRCMNKKLEKD